MSRAWWGGNTGAPWRRLVSGPRGLVHWRGERVATGPHGSCGPQGPGGQLEQGRPHGVGAAGDQRVLTGGLGSVLDLGAGNREIELEPPPDEPSLLTLTIELRGSEPRIWRRLCVPGDHTLDAVHPLFQAVMGWSDSHLHPFQPGIGKSYNQPYVVTEFDEEEGDEGTREDRVRLDQVLRAPGID